MNKLLLLLPLAAIGCGDPFQVGVKAERLCVRQLDQSLPAATGAGLVAAAPGAPPAIDGLVTDDFQVDAADLSDFLSQGGSAELGLQSFRMSADPADLAGLDRLFVQIAPPPGSNLEPLTLIDYDPATGNSGAGLVQLDRESGVITADLTAVQEDLMRYVDEGEFTMHLDAEGVLPAEAWNATVEVCAGVDVDYDYAKDLGL
jgi:hypothetical protein